MRGAESGRRLYRFGGFELEAESGELRKNGTRIRLQDQPLQILLLLLEHAGELVTREQIQKKLWAPDTYVDYDNAINSAMRKLRESLGDDSGDPRFIETFARRGYRFIGSFEAPPPPPEAPSFAPEPSQPPVTPAVTAKKSSRGIIAAVLAVLFVLAAVGWWLFQHPTAESKIVQLTPVPLTAALGAEFGASFSPDGNEVAYSWDGGDGKGFFHVYVKSIGSGKPMRLTTDSTKDVYPAWSPDGRSIAFVRHLDRTCQIYVVPALGGAETNVIEGFLCYHLRAPAWSPDGKFLAIPVSTSPDFRQTSLFLVRVEDGERLRLTTPPDAEATDYSPAFSSDGRALLFTRCLGESGCGLYLLNLAQGYRPVGEPNLLRKEIDGLSSLHGAAWTADGNAVIFSVRVGRNQHLMRVQAKAGAEPERLLFAGDHAEYPATSPRARRLAYTQVLSESQIWQIELGKPLRTFAASTRSDYSPRYSPGGRRVVFASNRSGSLAQIWTCDEDGGDPQQLTHFEATEAGSPRWSPDGQWIVFDRHLAEGYRVFVMSADGGQIHRLTTRQDIEIRPSWSSDGKSIYYACNRTGRLEVWKVPAQGGSATQVTRSGGSNPSESHDGQSLYYTNLRSSLWVLPTTGGDERRVLKSVSNKAFAVMADGIYYIPVPRGDGSASVRFHPFATGEETEIAPIDESMSGDTLTVSPDRKKLLLGGSERSGSNIMIVDNFR
jgi:Tol biopolymer transport system component/DNA-binding winged helix-turn-helix (wHTH) protein